MSDDKPITTQDWGVAPNNRWSLEWVNLACKLTIKSLVVSNSMFD
jgi:hypothetical protein